MSILRILFLFQLCSFTLNATASVIYINQSSDPEGIYAVEMDGTNLQNIIPGPDLSSNAGRAIAVNPADGSLFYSQTNRGMYRSNLDGSNIELISSMRYITDIEVDSLGDRIFYVNDDGAIYSSDLFGQNSILIGNGATRGGISYNSLSNSLFFMGYTNPGYYDNKLTINELDLTTGVSSVIFDLGESPSPGSGGIFADIEIDEESETLYWSDRMTRSIGTLSTDGSDMNILYHGLDDFWGPIAVDSESERIYYTSIEPNTLLYANFDGSGIVNISPDGFYGSMNIAIGPTASEFEYPNPPVTSVPEPPIVSILALGLIGLGFSRKLIS